MELPTIDVDESVTYQQMDGFGASLTDSSAWLISHTLDSSQRDRLLNDLFNPTTGIGLTFLRQPMGASDFTTSGNYSYDDMPAGQIDSTLANFSIDHDRTELIPLLKQIKTINPALKFMASPWSPPGWMKTSDSMIGGTLNADSWWSIYELNVYAASDLPLSRTNWVATAFSSPTICCYGDTPPKAIDDDGGTRWSSGVAQVPNNQWFQIDMGTPQTFDRIVMDAGSSGQDYPRAYQVYVSNDGTNWGDYVISGAGSPLTTTTTINFATQTARYFRIVQTGSASSAHDPLANYFVKFIQGYAAVGLPIDFISVQNEPAFSPPGYPGMLMTSSEQADFIKNHLGPALTNAGLLPKTKILIWDHNWTNSYPHEVLGDAAARAYVAGTAYHCYGGAPDSQTALHDAYPDMGIWLTECSGFTTTTFGDAFTYYVITPTIDVARNWGKSVVYWNLALNENQGPQNGGCQNCTGLVTINQSNGTVTYNAGYYALGHLSKFVTPGAYRIDTTTPGHIENVAFKNPDGAKVLLVFNSDATSATFKIRWAGKSFSYTLPARSAATFKWSGTGGQLSPLPKTNWVATAFSDPTICCQNDTPPKAIDGDGWTRWSSGVAQASPNQWFQIDMATTRAFNRIVMDAGRSNGDYPRAYQVYVSNDGTNWGDSIASGAGTPLTTINFPSQTARYFRILQTGSASSWWSIHELDVYGSALPLTVGRKATAAAVQQSSGHRLWGRLHRRLSVRPVVTLTATADAGSSFSGWTGACAGNDVCQVTMDAAKAVTATFALNHYPLTVAKEGNGSVASHPPGIDCGTTAPKLSVRHGGDVDGDSQYRFQLQRLDRRLRRQRRVPGHHGRGQSSHRHLRIESLSVDGRQGRQRQRGKQSTGHRLWQRLHHETILYGTAGDVDGDSQYRFQLQRLDRRLHRQRRVPGRHDLLP